MLFFDLLFEDDFILAAHKPSGLPSHSLSKDQDLGPPHPPPTVEAAVLRNYPDAKLLHRLDTGTSGVLVFAKNLQIYEEMRKQFQLKLVKKFYRAWSPSRLHSLPNSAKLSLPHLIETPLAHHSKSAKRMIEVTPSTPAHHYRSKVFPARTWIHAVHTHPLGSELEIEIETGVTHQIRVHLAGQGFPLVGDSIYNREFREAIEKSPELKSQTRLGLHAERIQFELRGLAYDLRASSPTFG